MAQKLFGALKNMPFVDPLFKYGEKMKKKVQSGKKIKTPPGVYYLTPRLIKIPFPDYENVEEVSGFLQKHHAGHYMIWNLSEHLYEAEIFNNQVLEFSFPGYPSPPVDVFFKINRSIKAWLDMDPENVAVIHCQASHARSLIVAACFLAWDDCTHYTNPVDALNEMCEIVGFDYDELFPSQKRYLSYFGCILDGFVPSSQEITLERVIMNKVPVMEMSQNQQVFCRPYIQVFKNGKMLFSSQKDEETPRYMADDNEDESVIFNVGLKFIGDILIRVRHLTNRGQRISMFRVVLHTGFIADNVMRITKDYLDGAIFDERFPDDFFIDLIFTLPDPNEITEGEGVASQVETTKVAKEELDNFWNTVNKESKVRIQKLQDHQVEENERIRKEKEESRRLQEEEEEEKKKETQKPTVKKSVAASLSAAASLAAKMRPKKGSSAGASTKESTSSSSADSEKEEHFVIGDGEDGEYHFVSTEEDEDTEGESPKMKSSSSTEEEKETEKLNEETTVVSPKEEEEEKETIEGKGEAEDTQKGAGEKTEVKDETQEVEGETEEENNEEKEGEESKKPEKVALGKQDSEDLEGDMEEYFKKLESSH
mmetsp:Transcript_3176/g.3425  ORF Transcript_3176/g.3425 Transcript_3176/m.3425 type:complete len:596 (-) Transcript_3176:108-1895(-)